MSNTSPFVSSSIYQWKSANIGKDRIDIHPQDPKFKIGRYYVGVMPYREGLNTVWVQLVIIDASKSLDNHKI